MNSFFYYALIFSLIGCHYKSNDSNPTPTYTENKSQLSQGLANALIPVNPDSVNNASYLLRVFAEEYEGLQKEDFERVELVNNLNIKNLGVTKLYKIALSNSLPESVQKINYLIVNTELKKGALLLLDTLIPLKTEGAYLVAGIQKIKTKGYFVAYDLLNAEFKEIFNSVDFCGSGIPVYNQSNECINYKPHMLSLNSENKKGILELNFSGKVAYYCKGLEIGFGESDRKPLQTKQINFSFLIKHKDNSYRYEFYSKDSICNLLKQ